MSRLSEIDERSVVGMLARIRANLLDIKTTPQPTSVGSGVRTYQVPSGDNWDKFEFVRKNGTSSTVAEVTLPTTGSVSNMNFMTIETEFEPDNQDSPVVYPHLELLIGGQQWEPRYHPNFGLTFSTRDSQSVAFSTSSYLRDKTDYTAERLIYKYETVVYYGVASGDGEKLRVRFRLRSTDRGKAKVKVTANV